jgi:hypothetical protein
MPNYFKQISSTDQSIVNTLISADYEGGEKIYVDDFGDGTDSVDTKDTQITTQKVSKLNYLSGTYVASDPHYDSELITDDNEDTYKTTSKRDSALFLYEDGIDKGLDSVDTSPNTNALAIGRLNLSK